ncbi:MAG: cation-translocating P-type ATPase [Asgard group archaeon]|nr:cation-translocating P-type ATPase [Asgard group archaeon]
MLRRNSEKSQEEIQKKLEESEPEVAYHAMDTGETLEEVDSHPTNGLTESEYEHRLERDGLNEIVEEGRTHPIILFIHQFLDVLIGLLFIAAIVSAAFGDWIEAVVIMAIVIINGIIGFVQEYQAEKSLEELKKIISKEVRVIREGEEHIIDSKKLVVGDIVLIEAGEKVPADMRLLTSTSLKVDESALTGESISLSKNAQEIINPKAVVGDRRNMLFMGTTVTYGRAKAVVVNTGMETEMGRIATLMQEKEREQTPLQKNLEKLGRVLAITIVIICLIVFASYVWKKWDIISTAEPGERLSTLAVAIENALALAVSAVPEGLPAAITLTYAIGVRLMAKNNAIVSRLPAVETLGVVDVICSDKTGTITKNEMTVTEIRTLNHNIEVTGEGYYPEGKFIEDGKEIDPLDTPGLDKLFRTAQLCNNAKINIDRENKEVETIGDPTELSLVVLARKAGLYDDDKFPREIEIFFDSQRKRMTTVNKQKDIKEYEEDLVAYSKGSPPVLLELCNYINIDGKVSPIDEGIKKRILEINDNMASRALRVLAIAYRVVDERMIELDTQDFLSEMERNIECDLIFVGLVGMIDPARPEVEEALVKCRLAGIRPVMVTGDQKITPEAIAKDIGLVQGEDWRTVTGTELEEMSDEELYKEIEDISIFARVSPEHKYRIVDTFQEKGHTVATTGDGVNDAPAVKKAEIGVAMGIQGTDVTREAAQMVLADDNFATIVLAVERGRTIFRNMLKFIRYLIASNFDEIVTVFVCTVFLGLATPYTPIQILWINLLTDGLPAIALSMDPPMEGIMREPPRDKDEGFMKDIYIFSIIAGFLAFVASMTVFVPLAYTGQAVDPEITRITMQNLPQWVKNYSMTVAGVDSITDLTAAQWLAEARTMNFTISVVFEMFNVFITRSGFERSTFTINPFNNVWLWLSIILAMGFQSLAIYVPMQPENGVNNTIFETMPLSGIDWLLILGICVIAAFIMELSKFIFGKFILKKWRGRKELLNSAA